ncbi:MAG TPA: SEC-C metal-binding domain-containing protein, partial [Nakamurella sp.]
DRSGNTAPDPQAAARAPLRTHPHRDRSRPVLVRAAYLPQPEHAEALALGLLDATVHREHVDYRRELQDALERLTIWSGDAVVIVPLDLAGMLEFARRDGLDPTTRSTRLAYSDSLLGDGRDIPWPPERNAPCWCGSGRKYKKCCGTPGFAAIQVDPASLVLKVELDNVDPPVWRRIAVPSNTPLDELHLLIQRAVGWQDDHPYGFETATTRFIDARFGSEDPSPDEERLVSIANEVGDRFTYVYDFGDYWAHTVTLEEIREAGEVNEPRTLDGAGACPPEDSGGVGRYTHLLEALADPTHADHEEAIEWFGESFDPTRYEPPVAR